jgi:hypothetical protein
MFVISFPSSSKNLRLEALAENKGENFSKLKFLAEYKMSALMLALFKA